MHQVIAFVLGNFTLTFFVIGLIVAAAFLLRRPRPLTRAVILDEVLAWFLFFSIGVSLFYNFVFHVFFGDLSEALHRHWASPQATRTQSADPMAANFSFQDDARSYEPLIADIVGNQARAGTAVATFQMMADLGAISGSVAVGGIAQHLSFSWSFAVSGGVLLMAAAGWLLAPETRSPADGAVTVDGSWLHSADSDVGPSGERVGQPRRPAALLGATAAAARRR